VIEVVGVHHIGSSVRDVSQSVAHYAERGYTLTRTATVGGSAPAIGNGLDEAALGIGWMTSDALPLELIQFTPGSGVRLGRDDPGAGSLPIPAGPSVGNRPDPDGTPPRPYRPGTRPRLAMQSKDIELSTELLGLLGFSSGLGEPGVLSRPDLEIELTRLPSAEQRASRPDDAARIHVCCEVADLDAAGAALRDRGFDLVSSPRRGAAMSWVFVRHPAGAGIELLQQF
jgi:hypothetical protein